MKGIDQAAWDILDGVADGILLVDGDGLIAYANRRAGDLFGYDAGELSGQLVEILVPEAARSVHERERRRSALGLHRRGMGSGLPLEGRRRDGSVVALDIALEPVSARGVVVASVRELVPARVTTELAAARQRERELSVTLDVIAQHLFAVGMSLGALRAIAPDSLAPVLAASTDVIDHMIEIARRPLDTDPSG